MSRDKNSRRLLRLRGWGRNGGIYGREAERNKVAVMPANRVWTESRACAAPLRCI